MNQFSTSDWIGIIGIVVSVILAFAFWQRIRRKTIILIIRKNYAVNTIKPSGFSPLKVLIDNHEISNFLYYLSGTFIVTGDGDISPDDIVVPLNIKIKDIDGIWRKYKVTNKTSLLNCNLEHDSSVLNFKVDNLMSSDFITFDAFYEANQVGYIAQQRILNVNKEVLILAENKVKDYWGMLILSIFVLTLFTSMIVFTNENLADRIFKPKYTKSTEVVVRTKEDSLRRKTYRYEKLYIINNKRLEDDKVLVKNKKLNERKNKLRKKSELKLLDSIQASKPYYFSRSSDSLNIVYHDSLYYHDRSSLDDIAEKIILKLVKQNTEIADDDVYKINDSINISFIKRSSFFNPDEQTEKNIFLIIAIFIYICFITMGGIAIYYIRLMSKYRKIYVANTPR
ncbi:hypothetical protein [Chryseobacterium indoltheticum]|uniref:Uncharacterized protein n=1 Tax=Chryseobacterium indoltheticum TaxID=254 RepID=A0A381F3V9_9FLAO|nr:hypothetical protein [Chryseobacterium indoltheticum]AZA74799.1 hypothetical protein EG358_13945 [Chryseobacterium indoltheticum]SIQ34888.1 hypothetical protein SAMN05421682_104176 [Chryseobacterium indoltheticum]SUX41236.1 Uncharacterised protein [Chryseobacterium indoltheticum]